MWIGIDLGTSACKVVAVDDAGTVVAHATRDYPLQVPRPGWAEQDPQHWWRATDEAVGEVVAAVDGAAVRGIGLCGQMHGLTALDADGEVLLPAILWNDQRCAAECDAIVDAAGGPDELLRMTNNRMLPGYTAGKLLWVRDHLPEAYAKIVSILNPKDYLRFRMTGRRCTDVSDASGTGLFDVRRRTWSTELLDRLHLDQKLLPEVVESTEITGSLDDQLAARWGLPSGTPVVGGGGDSVLQTTSMGITGPGVQGITLGTAGIIGAADTSCPDNPGGRLQISCGNAPDRWHIMGVSLNAGGDYAWLRSVLSGVLPDDQCLDFADLNRLARQAPPGSEELIFLPYLSGERAPHVAPEARGGWIGLTGRHGAAHLVRSVLEGVVLNIRQITELVAAATGTPDRVLVSGGASAEPIWLQLLADVLGQPISPVTGSEHGGAFGAALLAGVGTGGWPDLDSALTSVTAERTVQPDPRAHGVYDRSYPIFTTLYPSLQGALASLSVDEPTPTSVVFDLDGTLVDTAADIARAVNPLLADHGVGPWSAQSVAGYTGHGPHDLISGIYRAAGIQVDSARLDADVQKYLSVSRTEPVKESVLYADAAEALTALAERGVPVGVCTNKTEDMARRVLAAFGIDSLITAVVGADTIATRKPDPEHLLETVRRLGADPASSLYVGNSEVDLETADRAGITSWLVDWTTLPAERTVGRRRIHNFAEVVRAVAATGPNTNPGVIR